ncbi:hypothetical protein EPD60_05825 [Flaviaesturariibacter flavus]|uniref:DUF4235 domain-containing protein n=1 Tax=Flaviaesturariibacter flavus TaxID=2502780 RepID=A0A4R1BKA9_9BACT|nr:hypothetical protein [Flaviaesturariibacter flavus]TCJ17707.1 hypothetical protein EPD60_05825 [Flaviaesturariibacter flavus]
MKRGAIGLSSLGLMQELIHAVEKKSGRKLMPAVSGNHHHKGKGKMSHTQNVEFALELLTAAIAFGLIDASNKKDTLLWGGIIGGALGLGTLWWHRRQGDSDLGALEPWEREERSKPVTGGSFWGDVLSVGLYTASGLLAGAYTAKGSRKLLKKFRKQFKKK